ncbi:MAG: hypothetical protein IKY27_00330 [Bacteroidales bacterium]|nr:hypothetical protein [Bacteroidales bacterium]
MINLDNVCKPIKCCVCVHQERCSDNTTSLTFELACPKEIKIRLNTDYYTEHQRVVMIYILAQYALGNIAEKEMNETKTYEQGLEEAWEIARKIATISEGHFKPWDIFDGIHTYRDVFIKYPSIHEVKAKIEAWEAEKAKPKFGDVVELTSLSTGQMYKGIYVEENSLEYVVLDAYLSKVFPKKSACTIKKTDRHIDIQSLLEV